MATAWLVATIVIAVADWFATLQCRPRIRYFTKPATLIALLAWFTFEAGWQGVLIWFGLALVFSLLGDIFLLDIDRFFILGLVSFLLAHVFYIIGFNVSLPALSWLIILFLALVFSAVWVIFPPILSSLKQKQEERSLRVPVLVYSTVISFMLLSALLNLVRPDWSLTAALVTIVGAALFFTSDSLLATNRFAHPIRFCNLAVIVTYHLGQIAIIWGVLMQYSAGSMPG